jgi:hypothetical protein
MNNGGGGMPYRQ